MHGSLVAPPRIHFPSAASWECPVTSASTEKHDFFLSTIATILDNPSGILPIVLLASRITLIAVLLCLLLPVQTLIFQQYHQGFLDKHESLRRWFDEGHF